MKLSQNLTSVSVPKVRAGLTAVEVLIVIAVVSLLLSLLIPAVQVARNTARRLDCTDRQRQLGIALHQYLAAHQKFPSDNNKCFSWLVEILPMIEQESLHTKIREAGVNCWTGDSVSVLDELQKTPVRMFQCPMDPDVEAHNTSYLGNSGSGFHLSENGTISRKPATTGAFVDGLSNTAAVCEFLSGWGKHPIEHLDSPVATLEEWKQQFVPACAARKPLGNFPGSYMGVGWMSPGYPVTVYSHVLTPGQNSCKSSTGGTQTMIATPRSNHSDGVNLLMADGRVQFTSTSIDIEVWRQLGARDDSKSVWDY